LRRSSHCRRKGDENKRQRHQHLSDHYNIDSIGNGACPALNLTMTD
jgi:hypothetical protein